MSGGRPLSASQMWLRASVALAGPLILGALISGCGTAAADGTAPGSQSPAGNFAERILAGLKMPPGARSVPVTGLPATARNPWSGEVGAVDRSRAFAVPVNLEAAQTYVFTHSPAGTDTSGSGTQQGPHGVVSRSVYFHIGTVPAGIGGAEIQLYMIPGGTRSTVVAAYVHVTTQPSRTQVEHLAASDFRAVAIRANGKAVSTFASESVISTLIAAINPLPAAGNNGATSCPGSATDYRLVFEPRSASGSTVIVETYSCGFDDVTALGVPQPALGDRDNTIAALAAHLTHTRQYAS